MAYTYHGTEGLVKTGEVITILPSGLIQKKVTVVGRKVGSGRGGNSSSRVGLVSQIQPLTEQETANYTSDGFFAYPTLSSGSDLNNGFVQYDIVSYKKGGGLVNSVINYKYRKLSSFIIEDQFTPRTVDISVDVGVRSTIVATNGIKGERQNEKGDTIVETLYESPSLYQGELNAYIGNTAFTSIPNKEVYIYNDPPLRVETSVEYRPEVFVESVSSTFYGQFTEYIASTTLRIKRFVVSQNVITQ